MARNERQIKLLEIIAEQEIDTQRELAAQLRRAGFDVTQATVSRDIKELNIIKIGSGDRQRYAAGGGAFGNKFADMFRRAVVSVDCAVNIVVVKTLSGSAAVAGMMLDGMKNANILGCVAGDDTVFAVLRSPEAARALCDELKFVALN